MYGRGPERPADKPAWLLGKKKDNSKRKVASELTLSDVFDEGVELDGQPAPKPKSGPRVSESRLKRKGRRGAASDRTAAHSQDNDVSVAYGVGGSDSFWKTYELYDELSISRHATQEDIKKAYRREAVRCHPDKGGDALSFQRLTTAYQILLDPICRCVYDEQGDDALKFISQLNTSLSQPPPDDDQHRPPQDLAAMRKALYTLAGEYGYADEAEGYDEDEAREIRQRYEAYCSGVRKSRGSVGTSGSSEGERGSHERRLPWRIVLSRYFLQTFANDPLGLCQLDPLELTEDNADQHTQQDAVTAYCFLKLQKTVDEYIRLPYVPPSMLDHPTDVTRLAGADLPAKFDYRYMQIIGAPSGVLPEGVNSKDTAMGAVFFKNTNILNNLKRRWESGGVRKGLRMGREQEEDPAQDEARDDEQDDAAAAMGESQLSDVSMVDAPNAVDFQPPLVLLFLPNDQVPVVDLEAYEDECRQWDNRVDRQRQKRGNTPYKKVNGRLPNQFAVPFFLNESGDLSSSRPSAIEILGCQQALYGVVTQANSRGNAGRVGTS
ncbi:unnamed protein product [Vitrella brassicaformis CCMP3155]|uniref:J domain-containing protein n=1 Tax=Vitrella brassicaformis (strain CCMP3155) TaxID=1169540 RepID=A0A0G4EF54_VITBC|nr:unnamed protein product [Vitrella brassicaformis CCMP3155]|eukprot:CEL94026.1 unnamed protein product [Vitrella brassicaformis CCMP3155]